MIARGVITDNVTREADAAPCDVIIGEFVFGGLRCKEDAWYTVWFDGARWRVCAEHLGEGGCP